MLAYLGMLTTGTSLSQRNSYSKVARISDERIYVKDGPSHLETVSDEKMVSNQDTSKDVFEFDVVSEQLDFQALENEWNLLFQRFGQPHQVFLTFNWCWHWCAQFLGPQSSKIPRREIRPASRKPQLFIVTARRNGELVMVWPLVRDKKYGVTRLTWLGGNVSQYGDAIVADIPEKDALLRDGWNYILEKGNCDVVSLSKVRDDSNIGAMLADVGVEVEVEELAPFLNLKNLQSIDAYFKTKNPKGAKNRRRAHRRVEEKGEVLFEVLKPGKKAREITIKALEMKRQWLRKSGQFSRALSDPRIDQFFANVALDEQRGVGTRVSVLSIDGHCVAMEIGFECKGSLAVHVISYDNKFNKFSCGSLAMEESIRACWKDGFSSYDLLAPCAPFKMDWADQCVVVKDWHKATNARGQLWLQLYHFAGKKSLKRVMNCLPIVVRRAMSHMSDSMRRKYTA